MPTTYTRNLPHTFPHYTDIPHTVIPRVIPQLVLRASSFAVTADIGAWNRRLWLSKESAQRVARSHPEHTIHNSTDLTTTE